MITSLVKEIEKKYKIKCIKSILLPNTSDWCKIEFGTDRHSFLENRQEIEDLIASKNLSFYLDIAWHWEEIEYESCRLNNPTPTYTIFVGLGFGKNREYEISDTKDELYDISLFEFRNYWNKFEGPCMVEFSSWKRTNYGFYIDFFTKEHAEMFDEVNFLNRKLSWEKRYKEYRCHIFMTDKEELCYNIPLAEVLPEKLEVILTDEELFKLVKTGKLTLEEFKKLR